MMKNVLFILVVFVSASVYSQALDQLGSKDRVKVSGGMGFNTTLNGFDDQPQTREPFAWVATGNLNFTILGVSLPFTYSISNRQKSYTQPFNMTALHPSYKWFKSHIGITSMSFSSYTYGGLPFAGAGVELSPKNWKIKAFGGRLKKAIEYDASVNNTTTVSYRRMGGALSAGYEKNGFGVTAIFLKATDDPKSLQYLVPNSQFMPRDNFVSSLQGKAKLGKYFDLQAEIANSVITRNVLLTGQDSSQVGFYKRLAQGNSSSTVKNAYNAALNFKAKIINVSLKYERIDPDYATLGALYFNNDLENITLAPIVNLLKGKLNLSANTGFQRNNLSKDKSTQVKRWIGNVSLTAQPFTGMTTSLNYSNFSSFSRMNPAADPYYNPLFDTMNVYQVSKSMNALASYSFGKVNKKSVTGSYVFSQSKNITGRLEDAAAFGFNVNSDETPVNVHNAMSAFSIQFKAIEMSLSTTANYNQAELLGIKTEFFGPGASLQKKFFNKKLSTQFGTIYNQQYKNGVLQSHIMNLRLGASMSPQLWDKKYGQISLALNANYSHRFAVVSGALVPKNLTVVVNVNYSF